MMLLEKEVEAPVAKKTSKGAQALAQLAFNVVALYTIHQITLQVWRALTCC